VQGNCKHCGSTVALTVRCTGACVVWLVECAKCGASTTLGVNKPHHHDPDARNEQKLAALDRAGFGWR